MSTENRVALVTGGTSGIGRALVLALARYGWSVATVGRAQQKMEALQKDFDDLKPKGKLYTQIADLSVKEEVLDFCAASRGALGVPDLIVNNAGFNSRKSLIEETDLDEFVAQHQVHVIAPFLIYQQFAEGMKERGSGNIINILSNQVGKPNAHPGWAAYHSSKKAMQGLGEMMVSEISSHGIHVINALVGGVDSPFREEVRPQYLKPEEVAESLMALIHLPSSVYVPEVRLFPQVDLAK